MAWATTSRPSRCFDPAITAIPARRDRSPTTGQAPSASDLPRVGVRATWFGVNPSHFLWFQDISRFQVHPMNQVWLRRVRLREGI